MAKFVKLSKKQINSVLTKRLGSLKEYSNFDKSGNLQREFSSLLDLTSLEKIVEKYSETNPVLFSTFNIRRFVKKVIETLLKELVVEDMAELKAEIKFEAFEYDEDRRMQSWIESKEYDSKLRDEIAEFVDKKSITPSEELESTLDNEDYEE